MNWVDWIFIVVVGLGAYAGLKVGLIQAALVFFAMFVGWVFAGQVSNKVGGIFDSSLSNDTIITVATYVALMIVAIAISGFVARVVKPILSIFTLGLTTMADKLGGLVLGILLGFVIVLAVIVAGARLTYDFDTNILDHNVPAGITKQLPKIADVSEGLEKALTESKIVATVVKITDVLPAGALGLAPSDFGIALDILGVVIENQ
ncbi:MAG: CvpA family protein [Chloroflexota bacterium]|nr:CvpA family protein [Chloroflexota bacterium]MEE2656230.1 CvpA family protein [Chloroflexota bacterium]